MSLENDALLFFAKHELVQAHHTISFLRDCIYSLEHPDHLPPSQHAYPDQTEDRLRHIEMLVEIPSGCPHSYNVDDCESCERRVQMYRDAASNAAILGWAYEPGRWPRPPRPSSDQPQASEAPMSVREPARGHPAPVQSETKGE